MIARDAFDTARQLQDATDCSEERGSVFIKGTKRKRLKD